MRIEDQAVTEEVDRNPPRLTAVFYKPPKTNYCLYTYISMYQEATETFTMSQTKGKRTGVQPVYYKKSIKIRQSSFSGILNFNNVDTQFEWTMISIIPVLSKEHRNFCATYNLEQARNTIQKITIPNIKDENGHVCSKVYDLNDFDDKYLLYKQYLACISNRVSTLTMLDFSIRLKRQYSGGISSKLTPL